MKRIIFIAVLFFMTYLILPGLCRGEENLLDYIAPKPVGQIPYRIEITKGGAIKVSLKETTYLVTSEYSLIPDWAKLEEEEATGFSNLKISKDSFSAENSSFSLQRKLTKNTESIEVIDTITNKTSENLPLIIRHQANIPEVTQYYLAGLRSYMKRGFSSKPKNPTTIALTPAGSFGFLALNDTFRVHIQNFALKDKGTYGIADNNLVLKPKTTYTMRFALFPSEEKDYYAQVNAMRRYLDVNFQIPGSFAFFTVREKKIEPPGYNQFIPRIPIGKDMSIEEFREYFTNKNAYFTSAGPAVVHNNAWVATADAKPYRDLFARIKESFPNAHTLMYFHCFIEVGKGAKEEYKDSRSLNPDGTQADYRNPKLPLFFPTLTNSYGKDVKKTIDFILDKCGADGVYWDEFASSAAGYHFGEPWDGVSADIDPSTHKINRLKSSITLLTQPWRVEQVEKIFKQGKLLVINGNPSTETFVKYHFPRFTETGSVTNCVSTHLYTPIALGDHLTERSEKDAYRKMLEFLNYGSLYYWYYYLIWPEYPTLTTYMFPITPVELHSGYILGKERIITAKSGCFSFGDNSKVEAHFFDQEGREVTKEISFLEKDKKTYYKVELSEFESCVLIKK